MMITVAREKLSHLKILALSDYILANPRLAPAADQLEVTRTLQDMITWLDKLGA